VILIGLKLQAAVDVDSLDDAFKDAITVYGPQLEVACGLMGLRRVKVEPVFARHPLEGER
jgi:hypothetical protein